ncbi:MULTISPECIES: hypothetical protein [Vibrio harveyi group]|uniref:hypothetical protein n=1 Tax=Vibrio harveyi group TaxID=717610 RepID=UPI001BD23E07|nr:hypothetical protein [Vibrio alginolyticus]MDF4874423.1 hypothetical protein [Vibrio parahaemolyticus]EJU9970005.1 hypothetical protein [Vibrio alginolyticus]EKY4211252.1 hypothetical protein [Vibrio alginolyticus]ELA7817916.1 hypothetical protein [Vibrio alginolyticus]ELA7833197.1 hypothetical protein [Vibrio alginolyticus]
MKKLLFLPLIILSSGAYASEYAWQQAPDSNWTKGGVVMFSWDGESEDRFAALVRASRNRGGELVMFFDYYTKTFDLCEYQKHKDLQNHGDHMLDATFVHKFNGQPIRMYGFCRKGSDDSKNELYFTPETEAGKVFIVNEFKKSRSVKIDTDLGYAFQDIDVPADGFSAYWKKNNLVAL